MAWTPDIESMTGAGFSVFEKEGISFDISYIPDPPEASGGEGGSAPAIVPSVLSYSIEPIDTFPPQVKFLTTTSGASVSATNFIGTFDITLQYQNIKKETHHVVSKFEDIPESADIAIYGFFPPSITSKVKKFKVTANMSDFTHVVAVYTATIKFDLDGAVASFKAKLASIQEKVKDKKEE